MLRGFVYSSLAVAAFLALSVLYMLFAGLKDDTMYLMGGWLLLFCFFAVGPLFFVIGYWHHCRLHPGEPRWDAELNE